MSGLLLCTKMVGIRGSINKVSDHTIIVNVMHCMMIGKNCFKWSKKKDERPHIYEDVLCAVGPPKPNNRNDYSLANEDFAKTNKSFDKLL